MKLKNIGTALRNRKIAAEYALWFAKRHLINRKPTKTVANRVTIGDFQSFSEYYSVDKFISPADVDFFETMRIGDGVIADIGANVGVMSILLASILPDRKVYAFEPNIHVIPQLLRNLENNDASNVEVLQVALSDHVGEVLFDVSPFSTATARIVRGNTTYGSLVPCETLDHFMERLGIDSIAFLKVDVEGYEASVFRGAQRALAHNRIGCIYFEVCPKLTNSAGSFPEEAAQILSDADYSLFRIIDGGALVPVRPQDVSANEYDNWVAMRDRL